MKVPTSRAPNAVQAYPAIHTSTDGLRRVYSRNAKRSTGNHRYDVVRVYRLASRVNGKWETVKSGTDLETATHFLQAPIT